MRALRLILALALAGLPAHGLLLGRGARRRPGRRRRGRRGDPGPQTCTTLGDCPTQHLCLGGFCQPGPPARARETAPRPTPASS